MDCFGCLDVIAYSSQQGSYAWRSLAAQETLKTLGMSMVRVWEQSCVALWSVSQPLVTEETPKLRRTSCCAPVPSTPGDSAFVTGSFASGLLINGLVFCSLF